MTCHIYFSPRSSSWWGGAGRPRTLPPLSVFQASVFGHSGFICLRSNLFPFSDPSPRAKILSTVVVTLVMNSDVYIWCVMVLMAFFLNSLKCMSVRSPVINSIQTLLTKLLQKIFLTHSVYMLCYAIVKDSKRFLVFFC